MKIIIKSIYTLVAILMVVNCSKYQKLEKLLPPKNREFLSHVRYIISKQERKDYINTSENKRDEFEEEFWKRRDPDPNTVENEYKEEYFSRMKEANELFKEEREEGWLTERGYVFMILGPPNRITYYPFSMANYDPPLYFIWYYNEDAVMFKRRGYLNSTYYLTPESYTVVQRLKELIPDTLSSNEGARKYTFPVKFVQKGDGCLVRLLFPYKYMTFTDKNGKFTAQLKVTFEAIKSSGKSFLKIPKEYTVTLKQEDLENLEDKYSIEEMIELAPGKYILKVSIEDLGSGGLFHHLKNIQVH